MKKPIVLDKWIDNPEYITYKAWVKSLIDAENAMLAPKEVTLRFRPPFSYLENGLDIPTATEGELSIILDFRDPLNARHRTLLNRKMLPLLLQKPLLAKEEY